MIKSPKGPISLDLELDILVGINGDRRGAHLSRNIEAIRDAIETPREAGYLEEYLEKVAHSLLNRHGYADKARVSAKTRYYVDVEYSGIRGEGPVEREITGEVHRDGSRRWRVSVTVYGMTVCPSAQATISRILGLNPSEAPSHSQKAVLRGTVETRGAFVRVERIARALFSSFSAPTITLLKRRDEARLIIEAFKNPVFVEDLVRRAIVNIASKLYAEGIKDAVIEVEANSIESIHPHNVYAYKRITLDEFYITPQA